MAIVPDITAIDLGSGTTVNASNVAKALKDYFDPGITTASGSANINAIRQDNRASTGASEGPAESPNFELVNNTNDAENFTITPKDSNENWHAALDGDAASTEVKGLIDPQGDITSSTTQPPTVGSSGPPEESRNTGFIFLDGAGLNTGFSKTFYVIEFVDAIYVLTINDVEDALAGVNHFGRIFVPYLASFGSGFGKAIMTSGGSTVDDLFSEFRSYTEIQWDPNEDWLNSSIDALDGFDAGYLSGQESMNVVGSIKVNTPDGNRRNMCYPRYMFRYSGQPETPGIVLDGGSKTDFVYVSPANSSSSTDTVMLPWDANLTPIFQ